MVDEPNRTVHAQQAFEFTDLFAYKFGSRLYGQPPRRLRLMEPDGPSTAGGRQARQSIVLQPDEGEQKLVLGWIDVTQKTAELKGYNLVKAQHLARFSQKFGMDRGTYDAVLKELIGFLNIQKIEHKVLEGAPVGASRSARSPAGASSAPAASGYGAPHLIGMLVMGVVIGVALGFLLFGGSG